MQIHPRRPIWYIIMRTLTSEAKEYYQLMGSQLGYQSCCIEDFLERVTYTADRSYRTACYRKLSGSGFVPCSACDKKYSEEELINVINNNRSKTLPSFVHRTCYHPILDMKTKTVKVEYHMKTKTGLIVVRLNKFFPTAFTNLKKYWR